MNVNEYAQQVLFSDDLEEKLRLSSDTIEFDFQQVNLDSELKPSRPDSLRFDLRKSDSVSRFSLPSRPSLVDDRKRGQLLHFFANHELLAAELMALALLRFPDAPEPFRRGLFDTLVEEQKHTLWYLGRMKECGVSLGEYPVSGFFWNTVSNMAEPIDYVSRLSLTFEQANLDYSLHFAKIMEQVGDSRTAKIMAKIYQDEISHVNYGLEWFRKWKPENRTDWEAYQDRLNLPLSPSRAKANNGIQFNAQGRLDAGLDDAFVRQLSVFERSKGRSPNLFHFNPDAEDLIAAHLVNQPYQPSKKVRSLITDLEILQVFLARQDDVILMQNPPSLQHLERLQSAGFQLPEIARSSDCMNNNRQIRQIQPWSAAPNLDGCFQKFETIEPSNLWQEGWAELFSKANLNQQFGEDAELVGTSSQLQKAAKRLATDRGVVLKIPISAAGRGVKFVSKLDQLNFSDQPLVVEPWHHRVFDFSIQFEVSAEGLKRIGLIRQSIDPQTGRYLGSVSSPKFCKGLSSELAQFLMQKALPMYNENSSFCQTLYRWTSRLNYVGPLGIDSYLYNDHLNGELKHRVVCEINPRFTMGRVAHEIRRQIAPGHSLRFSVGKASGPVADSPSRLKSRLNCGALTLNEITPATFFAATITVNKDPNLL